jgi:SAM-dependent methyltransferase
MAPKKRVPQLRDLDDWDGQRETLDDLSQAVHYNRWINGLMDPHLGHRILEIGCGTGNMTAFLAEKGEVLAMDVHEGYLRAARKSLKGYKNVSFGKLGKPGDLKAKRSFRPDTVVCVNVLEHIPDDLKVLRDCWEMLPKGGKVLLFVPALQWLFGSMDESYGHQRRYGKEDLEALLTRAGFQVQSCRYLNLLGILGWWLNGKVLRRPIVPKGQMLLYDQVVRFVGPFEHLLPRPIGLSLFCSAVKQG